MFWRSIVLSVGILLIPSGTVTSGDPPLSYRAEPAEDWTRLFLDRSEGWTGADGIFSVRLDGDQRGGIENRPDQRTVFVFSDTLVGRVDRETKKRSEVKMVNHSFALLRGNRPFGDRIEFYYPGDGKTSRLPIKPSKEGQWYWLSECFVLPENGNPKLYAFLLRIEKTDEAGAFGFRHVGVDLLRLDVRDGQIDFDSAEVIEDDPQNPRLAIFDQKVGEQEGPVTISFGIGVLENTAFAGAPDPDGFIYVYGYRDSGPWNRQLVAARFKPENVCQPGRWSYYAGNGAWSDRLFDAVGFVPGISTELSVTPIPEGPDAGKYALVYTPGTIGSTIALRLGESPLGPFGEPRILYEEPESRRFGKGVFAYNAKAHPVLSATGELLISYNINSNDDQWRIFREADIYSPRFIRIQWGGEASKP